MTAGAFATERDVVRVEGPDAETYLQGQLSQDVDSLAVATSTWTFVLAPDGKVDSWARLTKTAADAFLLDVDAGAGERLETRLRRFLLRTKAEISADTVPVVMVRGADAPRADVPDDVLRLPVAGPGVEGYDLLGAGATVPSGAVAWSRSEAEVDRIRHAVPAFPNELSDGPIPAELGSWIIDASVSFTKGCFVGQELTARIDSRGGNVPRHLRVVTFDGPVPAGSELTSGDAAGIVTSAVATSAGTVALAFCGRKIEPGAAVTAVGVPGEVHDVRIA